MKCHINIPIFVPEVGCPHQCVFCNQSKITDSQHIPTDQDVITTIEQHLATADSLTDVEIAFFGGSFTGIHHHIQERLLRLAHNYIQQGRVSGIRISTRPDYIDDDKLSFLKQYGVTAIELGAQSLNDNVLQLSERGHSVQQVEQAAKSIKQFGFELGLQMMIGLPGDTPQGAIATANKIVDLQADTTRIYPCLIIKDTKLAAMYSSGSYHPLTLQAAVDIVADLVPIFERSQVKILRIGLHPSEGLISGTAFLEGPFHCSFRQLVNTQLWKRQFDSRLNYDLKDSKIVIHCSPLAVNDAAGYNASNRKYLQQRFKGVAFMMHNRFKNREFDVVYN